jgi:DNA repair protein SbcC/Rad50
MRIERFASQQFAGLREVDLSFGPGLNVVLGANETGKSTIINAIMAVLFINTNLKKNRSDDKEFVYKYMPYPSGDFIDGRLDFSQGGQSYHLNKQWGNKPRVGLNMPDGTSFSSEGEIEKRLRDLFGLGTKTYQTVVFARQNQLKEALGRLSEKETVHSVKKQLTAAVMNLDGISIDLLQSRVEAELENLLKRWDYNNRRPEDTRTYKSGVGQVLNAYYRKRALQQEMDRVFALEQQLHGHSLRLQGMESEARQLDQELKALEPLEEDILKRAEIEPQLNQFKKQSQELRGISVQWPALEHGLNTLNIELDGINQQLERLSAEEEDNRNQKERDDLIQLVAKLQNNRGQMAAIQIELEKIVKVSQADISTLEKLQGKIQTSTTAMEAGRLTADIRPHQDLAVYITRDLETETPATASALEANGYFRIRVPDVIDIEVRSGQIDFNSLKQTYLEAQAQIKKLLGQLAVENIETARQVKQQFDDLSREMHTLEQNSLTLMGERTLEHIIARIEQLQSSGVVRNLPTILEEKKLLQQRMINCQAQLKTDRQKLQLWQERYQDQAHLLDSMINQEVDIRQLEGQLAQLSPLPEKFASTGDFRLYLRTLRTNLSGVREQIIATRKLHDDTERELPDESYQELQQEWLEAGKQLERRLARADKLNQIKQAFSETRTEMESDPLQPLIESFSRYLTKTTAGRYTLGKIEDDFELRLLRQDGTEMPVSLFSSGTYDCAALALRFALLEQIFNAEPGCVVLDDCLVDLDPDRREEAARMIRDYAASNQVIFTTCTPQTAELLGGNLILLD